MVSKIKNIFNIIMYWIKCCNKIYKIYKIIKIITVLYSNPFGLMLEFDSLIAFFNEYNSYEKLRLEHEKGLREKKKSLQQLKEYEVYLKEYEECLKNESKPENCFQNQEEYEKYLKKEQIYKEYLQKLKEYNYMQLFLKCFIFGVGVVIIYLTK